jgi:very-short-patch-repair endonuclease
MRTNRFEVTARPGRNPKIPGVRVHRPALLPDHDMRVVGGIPTTSYARTLVDCTGRSSLGQIARALDAGLVRRDVTVWSVERSLSALGQAPGRHPSKLWTLLAERSTVAIESESRPEIRMLRVLRVGGLPAPTQQHWVKFGTDRFRLDLAYPEAKVAIEYDGWDAHRSRGSFDSDRRRDRILQLAGWVVLRITSQTPDAEIVETVRAFVP